MQLLENQVAIVTGAARGIGRAIAQVFAENGAHVVLADLLLGEVEAAAQEICATCCKAIPMKVDVGDPLSIRSAVRETVAEFGSIHILVNNAGVLKPHLIVDFPVEDWDLIFKINVRGTFLFSQEVARQFILQGKGGCIINVASASAKKADREESAYCASKSAVIGFTRVLALELGQYGIRANAILPGATDTEMLRALFAKLPEAERELLAKTPLGKIATPRDQANAALFLASPLAAHITGEQLVVSGGEFMET